MKKDFDSEFILRFKEKDQQMKQDDSHLKFYLFRKVSILLRGLVDVKGHLLNMLIFKGFQFIQKSKKSTNDLIVPKGQLVIIDLISVFCQLLVDFKLSTFLDWILTNEKFTIQIVEFDN